MKRLAAVLAVGLGAAAASGQYTRVWTQPAIPTPEALDRLNLRLGWSDAIPVSGYRDGIATVQNLGDVIIVQERSGAVTAIDPVTGAARWRTAVGLAYPVTHNVGFNDTMILVANGARIYGLDRATGGQLWTVELSVDAVVAADGERRLRSTSASATADCRLTRSRRRPRRELPGPRRIRPAPAEQPPTTGPRSSTSGGYSGAGDSARAPGGGGGRTVSTSVQATDGRSVTTAMQATGGRTATGGGDINRTARGKVPPGSGPRLLWDYQTNLRASERPIVGERTVLVVGTGREAVFVDKEGGQAPDVHGANRAFTAPPAHYFDIAYTGCANGTVYAFNLARRAVHSGKRPSTARLSERPTATTKTCS